MKKAFLSGILLLTGIFCTRSQDSLVKRRIAVFTPLYLDSAFDATNEYRYAKNVFPKFINPGLEFYEGVQLALDSLAIEKAPLEVFVYDTRSATETLAQQIARSEADSVELILAYCSNPEVRMLADAGLRRKIPVINVNLPNDGGVSANPYFVILNPTLKTQCEGIYRHLQKHFSKNNLVVFRKKGQLEDRIRMYLDEYGKSTVSNPAVKLKYVDLIDSFTVNHLLPYLDTLNQTVCIAGTMDEHFGKRLVQHLATLKKQKYQSIVMGMPTWDGIRDFNKPEYKGVEIMYSTPFYNPRTDKVSLAIIEYFNTVMYARPSDMVMRGYEAIWRFGKLLLYYDKDIASSVTHKEFNIFRDFDIQPEINPQTMTLDYFENKKLYFLRYLDGVLKTVY